MARVVPEDPHAGLADARAGYAYLNALLAIPLGYFGGAILLNLISWLVAALATASVPDEVNTTSRARAPKNSATCVRASSSATRVARPSAWRRPGSAWCSRR